MLGTAPISPNPAESPLEHCSPTVLGEQAQFQQSLTQVGSTQDDAASVGGSAAFIPPVLEVQRAITQASPLGERVLQTLSAVNRSATVPSVAVSSGSARVQPGPAVRPVLQSEGVGVPTAGKPEGADSFESMVVNLRDVYNNVIQVSLISKTAGTLSSSLNKLLSAG
ncbi:nodulation protein NolB [Bradyrhizobium sp. USDA 10063]